MKTSQDPTEPIECAAVSGVRDVAASLAHYREALGFATAFA